MQDLALRLQRDDHKLTDLSSKIGFGAKGTFRDDKIGDKKKNLV